MSTATLSRVSLDGVGFDALTEGEAVAAVRAALDRGEGGRIVTPNVDIMRMAQRKSVVRDYLADATLVVADGMPLVWASRLAGTPLPQRVPGSGLIWSLSDGLAADRRSVYVLGGQPATEHGAPDGAARAAYRLAQCCPGLRVAGHACPPYGFESHWSAIDQVCADVVERRPDLVFVGLGFAKQEWLISLLRPELPGTWFLGCGAAVNFVAGDVPRAPQWMQRSGLEWLHRMSCEPRRLAGRYLGHDAPYALRLLRRSARAKVTVVRQLA